MEPKRLRKNFTLIKKIETRFVTFLYELDRTAWPDKWKRSFQNYLKKFKRLLESDIPSLLVFSDDSRVEDLIQRVNNPRVVHIRRSLRSWSSWKQLPLIEQALHKKRGKFNVPEFFSAEYICLQLCKADAIMYATELTTQCIFWIDAGFGYLPSSWNVDWSDSKLHFLQIGHVSSTLININTPTVHFSGGLWGGVSLEMKWFCETVRERNAQLLDNGECANDQQLFSIIHRENPHRFIPHISYQLGLPFPILLDGHWTTYSIPQYDIYKVFQSSTIHSSPSTSTLYTFASACIFLLLIIVLYIAKFIFSKK
jgi:hypothetical protein